MARQLSLFGAQPPRFDASFSTARRHLLGDGAWIEYAPGWLYGDDALFELLVAGATWHADRRIMYEREVDVPRLTASLPEDSRPEILRDASAALSARYGVALDRITLAWYRDGRDSVAWHGDRIRHVQEQATVAILSLGTHRRFLLRPAAGGSSRAFALGGGDLLVMGGTAQRTWQHSVPKAANGGPRISVMFRHGPDEDEPLPAAAV